MTELARYLERNGEAAALLMTMPGQGASTEEVLAWFSSLPPVLSDAEYFWERTSEDHSNLYRYLKGKLFSVGISIFELPLPLAIDAVSRGGGIMVTSLGDSTNRVRCLVRETVRELSRRGEHQIPLSEVRREFEVQFASHVVVSALGLRYGSPRAELLRPCDVQMLQASFDRIERLVRQASTIIGLV